MNTSWQDTNNNTISKKNTSTVGLSCLKKLAIANKTGFESSVKVRSNN